MALDSIKAKAQEAWNSAKPYVVGDGSAGLGNPLVTALMGGGLGAALTGSAAHFSPEIEGETPAMRRKRVLREVLTGGGVGAAAGFALPAGVNMMSGMLPEMTSLGEQGANIEKAFAPGTSAANTLSYSAGLLPMMYSSAKKLTGRSPQGAHVRGQVSEFAKMYNDAKTSLGAAADAQYSKFQSSADAFKKQLADYTAKSQAPVPAGKTQKPIGVPQMPVALAEALGMQPGTPSPTSVAALERILASSNISPAELEGRMLQRNAHAPVRDVLARAQTQFGKARSGVNPIFGKTQLPAIEFQMLGNELANRGGKSLARGFTGNPVPHPLGSVGRNFLPSKRSIGAGLLLSLLAPAAARSGGWVGKKIDSFIN